MSSRRFKIYQDEVKARQTTHWDLDYLSAQQLQELMRQDPEPVLRPRRSAVKRSVWQGFVSSLSILAIVAMTYLVSK